MTDQFYLKIFCFLYGIQRELTDQEIGRILKLDALIYRKMTLLLLAGIFLEGLNFTNFLPFAVMIALIVPLYYQDKLVRELQLDKMFVARGELKEARKFMLRKTLRDTFKSSLLALATCVMIWMMNIPQESGTTFDTFWKISVPGTVLLMTVIVLPINYIANRKKIILTD